MKRTITVFLMFFLVAYAISYKDLYQFLIEINGWSSEKPTGSKITSMMGEMLSAERSYSKENKYFKVSIIKGMMATSLFAPFSMVKEVDTPEEYIQVFKMNGFKAGLNYNKVENSGNIIVILTGDSVFSMEFQNMSYKEAKNLLKKFPLKDIAKKLLEL